MVRYHVRVQTGDKASYAAEGVTNFAVMSLQDDRSQLPVQRVPHDTLRHGLSALKDEAELSHPVEAIQAHVGSLQM
jgi:hypothetical protein